MAKIKFFHVAFARAAIDTPFALEERPPESSPLECNEDYSAYAEQWDEVRCLQADHQRKLRQEALL